MESRTSTDDTATTALETPESTLDADLPDDAGRGRTPWHDRPPVLIAASIAGIAGLAALAFSVVSVSDQSTRPAAGSATAVSTASASRAPETTISPSAEAADAPPPLAPADPPSVPDFAAGPTAEMKVIQPPPPPPGPNDLQSWLRRLFPNWNAGAG